MTHWKKLPDEIPLVIVLPIKPVPASRPRVTHNGHVYYESTYQEFKDAVPEMITELMEEKGFELPVYEKFWNLGVKISITKLRPKKPANEYPHSDLDNFVKAVLDAMNGIVYADDRQIVQFKEVEKFWGSENLIRIKLWPVTAK